MISIVKYTNNRLKNNTQNTIKKSNWNIAALGHQK